MQLSAFIHSSLRNCSVTMQDKIVYPFPSVSISLLPIMKQRCLAGSGERRALQQV